DIGIDDGGNTSAFDALGKLDNGELRRFRPAFNGHHAAASIDTDGNLTRPFGCSFLDQRRVAHGNGAKDDAGEALVEPGFDMAEIADTAAKLDGEFHCLEDFLDSATIDALTGKGPVEVD